MTKNGRKRFPFAVAIVIGAALLGLLVEYTVHPMHHLYDRLQNNYNHYLPCQQLPATAEVERILEEHTDTVKKIAEVHPGFTYIEAGTRCPETADVIIHYATRDERLVIKDILGGSYTFFGVPARWRSD